jgi:hypothetical protein
MTKAKRMARGVRKDKSVIEPPHEDHEYRRILLALGQDKAYGVESSEHNAKGSDIVLIIIAQRKSVSVRVARSSLGIATALCRDDLAHWEKSGTSGKHYLRLTPTGRAKIKRLQASDEAGAFYQQHVTLQKQAGPDKDSPPLTINAQESPLAWLAARRGRDGQALLSPSCVTAGERLRSEVERAQMVPRMGANWSAPMSLGRRDDGALHFSEAQIAARQRVMAALRAVGPDFADILLDVCVFLKGLEVIEQERAWPARSAKLVLKLALARLANHYGYALEAIGPSHARSIEHWGSEDYRPHMG